MSQNAGTYEVRGLVVDATASTSPWHGVAGVMVVFRNAEANDALLGSTVTDGAGQYRMRIAYTPANQRHYKVSVHPPAGSPYRVQSSLEAYTESAFEYIGVERADGPVTGMAPVLVTGVVTAPSGGAVVAGARVHIWRDAVSLSDSGRSPSSSIPAFTATATADANGHFIIAMPVSGWFNMQALAPAGSAFRDGSVQYPVMAGGHPTNPELVHYDLQLRAR